MKYSRVAIARLFNYVPLGNCEILLASKEFFDAEKMCNIQPKQPLFNYFLYVLVPLLVTLNKLKKSLNFFKNNLVDNVPSLIISAELIFVSFYTFLKFITFVLN